MNRHIYKYTLFIIQLAVGVLLHSSVTLCADSPTATLKPKSVPSATRSSKPSNPLLDLKNRVNSKAPDKHSHVAEILTPENEPPSPKEKDVVGDEGATVPAEPDAGTTVQPAVPAEPEQREFFVNWDGITVGDMIKVFCEDLDLRYLLAPGLNQNEKMTVRVGNITDWTREQRLALFDALLSLHALKRRLVGELWHIEPVMVPGFTDRGIFQADDPHFPEGEAIVVGVMKFDNITPNDAMTLFKQMTNAKTARFYSPPQSSLLLVIDVAEHIRQMQALAKVIDVDPTVRKHYILKHADAPDVQKELASLFPKGKGGSTIQFVALERINAVVVYNANPGEIEEVDRWLRMLDVTDRYERMVTRVYRMKVEQADTVAKLLNDLYVKLSNLEKQKNKGIIRPGGVPAKASPGEFKGEVIILSDKSTNSIIIHATPGNHRIIEQTIKQLDRPRKQVLIEVVIAEVTLDESTELGIEWALRQDNNSGKRQHTLGSNTNLGALGIAEDFSKATNGMNYLVTGTDKFLAMLHAANEESRLQVLQSPTILTADNVEAKISIGQEVPVETQTINNNVLTTSFQYKDAKIELKVTPHINDERTVTLELSQVIKEIQAGGAANAPSFLTREIETNLQVADGQTLVIGGLIKRTESKGENGVPGLSKVPLLGKLFKSDSNKNSGTELLMILTPRVVVSRSEADCISAEFQQKILGSLKRENIEEELHLPPREDESETHKPWWRRMRRRPGTEPAEIHREP